MRMFKLHLGLLLAFSFFMSAIVPQGAQAQDLDYKISRAFDQFHYAMNVEWDQKDPAFRDEAQAELEMALTNLQDMGLSAQDLKDYMFKNILTGNAQREFSHLLSATKSQNLSEEEITQLAMRFVDRNYHEGASFMGHGGHHGPKWGSVICVIVVVAVIMCCMERGSRGGHSRGDHHGDDYHDGEYSY